MVVGGINLGWIGILLHPRIQRMGADTQSLRNLVNRISPYRNLMHRVPLEIVTKFCFAHVGLLASFLETKVSTILGAIQCKRFRRSVICLAVWRCSFLNTNFPGASQLDVRSFCAVGCNLIANNYRNKFGAVV